MEANYSNYDRSQIKLKFKTPNKPQRKKKKKNNTFFFYLFLSKEEGGGRKGCKIVGLDG